MMVRVFEQIKWSNMIKLLRTTIVALFMSIATTPLMAGSGDFSGPYVSFQAAVVGGALDGEYRDQDGAVTKGTGGATFPIGGIEAGWNIGLGDTFLIGVGATYNAGSATISNADDAANAADVRVKLSDQVTLFVQPQISFAENSEAYAKFGYSQVLLNCAGNVNAETCKNLDGKTIALGTKTKFGNGIFFQTEAGASAYQGITLYNIGGSSTAVLSARPTVAYGAVAIGYQF